jgi:hypothetical protein
MKALNIWNNSSKNYAEIIIFINNNKKILILIICILFIEKNIISAEF